MQLSAAVPKKIYSGESRNPGRRGIVSWSRSRPAEPVFQAGEHVAQFAELEEEDEIPQQRVIKTSPARQEVIAADAHHSGRLLAARSRSTTCADTDRHKN
ncbi:hypothetical protein ACTI_10010 [Actinoplanes sp. OR16]|nr:hypothetical protein ACTI_10010 [Actinoplanes sp. OR16]